MRILNVNIYLGSGGGGTGERTYRMSQALIRAGQHVRVVTTSREFAPATLDPEVTARTTVLPLWTSRFLVPRVSSRTLRMLITDVDVAHLMNHWNVLNALVYRQLHRNGIPYVFCPAGALRIYGRSVVLKWIYHAIVGQRIVDGASRIIAITEAERAYLAGRGVHSDKIVVIPNGIDPRDFEDADAVRFRARFRFATSAFILFLGRLNSIKGPDLLLRAYARAQIVKSNFDLIFAGPDEGLRSQLSRIAQEENLSDRVHFTGTLDATAKRDALQAAAFVAIPSRHEAMSIVVLEAGVSGKPVVITDQCGMDQIASVGGGVVVPATVEGLADGLARMIRGDHEEMGARLKQYCLENYSWPALVQRYLTLYAEILGEARTKAAN